MRSKIGILKYAAAVVLSGMVCSCTKGLDGNQPDLVNPGGSQEATFYVYEAPDNYEGVPKSPIYKVAVIQNGIRQESTVFYNTCPVWQSGYMDMTDNDQYPLGIFAGRSISWTGFSFSGKVAVEVEVLDETTVPVTGNVRILPSRYGITPEVEGNVVRFTMDKPGYCSVEIGTDGFKNGLMIFADPLETDRPAENASGYLMVEHASADAVSPAAVAGYQGLYFRPGVHDIGKYSIPSNIKYVYLAPGAWVYGAFSIENNPGVKIFGRGVLSSGRMKYREAHCIEDPGSSGNITLQGIVVADPKYFSVRLIGSDNTVDRVKIIGSWTYNCDGIAAYAGSTVSNCFIWANDDNIKVYRDNIKVHDIVCWQLNNGGLIQLGWTGPQSSNCEISRIDILHAEWNRDESNRGVISLVGNKYHTDGAYGWTKNWIVEDVVTETPVSVLFNFQPDPYTDYDIDGLVMKDWTLLYDRSLGFHNYMKGTSPEHKFKGIVFDNVTIDGVKMTAGNWMEEANFIVENAETPEFK